MGHGKLHLFAARHRCGRQRADAAAHQQRYQRFHFPVRLFRGAHRRNDAVFANGSLRLHTGSDLSVTCGSGYETVDTSSYPNAFEAQWADFISGVRAGRILYCDGTYGASIVRTIELLYH